MWTRLLSRPLPEAPVLAQQLATPRPKTKQRATDQQGVCDIVAGVMEWQGVRREDWEQPQRTDYRMEPFKPPTWVVYPSPDKHLAMLKDASVDEWQAELNITADQLLRQLTTLAKGTHPSLQLP